MERVRCHFCDKPTKFAIIKFSNPHYGSVFHPDNVKACNDCIDIWGWEEAAEEMKDYISYNLSYDIDDNELENSIVH